MKTRTLILFALLILPGCRKSPSGIELPSLIGENMVLQQKTDVKIWGKANPGQKIIVSPAWGTKSAAKTDKDGKWLVTVPTPEAGGPYTLSIEGSDTSITLNNIMTGEVWFCSGQSNMEMPVAGWPPNDTIMGSENAIASSSNNDIRLFLLQRNISGEPLDGCKGSWVICSPQTVNQFSATGYFFGKRINEKTHLPVGLIESSWGGTPVESWISSGTLENAAESIKEIDEIKKSAPLIAEYRSWLNEHKQISPDKPGDQQWKDLSFNDEKIPAQNFDDSSWPSMKLPGLFENTLGEFDGAVWFRKSFKIPSEFKGKDLILSLGPIDDMDLTYFNGEQVGATEAGGFWQVERNYEVPGRLVHDGSCTIAVRVLDTQGGGGIYGKPGLMKLTLKGSNQTPLNLEGEWEYQPVAEWTGNRFYIFDIAKNEFTARTRPKSLGPNTPTVLYNAMVNPAVNYTIKGALWYQGESNVGRAEQYAKIFALMIQNWREAWGIKDFPFYFVQIAPYVYSNVDSAESVLLREAQANTLKVKNTGMVVTLDIATVMNIHPPFKKEVGERLADLALANDYGINVPCLGPVYKSMAREGNIIKIQFDNVGSGLQSRSEEIPEFEIAGDDGRYIRAKAVITGNEIVVSSEKIKEPRMVRYCWRNGATGTLFNSDGLPASQFSTKLQ